MTTRKYMLVTQEHWDRGMDEWRTHHQPAAQCCALSQAMRDKFPDAVGPIVTNPWEGFDGTDMWKFSANAKAVVEAFDAAATWQVDAPDLRLPVRITLTKEG